ncbi:FAD/NAD(P)-binding domain-containing protein [Panaeolus papilionaceus]|nr:FAD/NAD(P)-binding domain-containing protein [Panaeolus papilionaceus]
MTPIRHTIIECISVIFPDYYDCVIVGSGHAGSCAALAAIDAGCVKVLMVDKCPEEWVGGNGYFTAGAHRTAHGGLLDIQELLVEPLSQEQLRKIDVEPYTAEQFKNDIHRLGGNRANQELVQTLVDESREAVGWLRRRVGVPFVLSTHRQAYEVAGRIKFWGGMALAVEDGGKGLIAAHQRCLRKAGVEIWTDCRATQVLMASDRATGVSGLMVEKKGGMASKIDTRCVVLAAGGFEASAELRKKYLGEGWESAKVRGTPYNTGDGFYLAAQVGAKLVGDWKGCHSTAWDANAEPNAGRRDLTNQYTKSGYPLGIMVNKHGKRFVDEGEDYRNYTYAKFGRKILEQPGGFAFQIWDGKMVGHLRKEEYGEGVVEKISGNTLAELADKLEEKGLKDKGQLLATIKEYNEAVDAGLKQTLIETGEALAWNPAIKDGLKTVGLEINKTNWARSIEEGPLMGVKVACGITFTFGGLKLDASTAGVMSVDDEMIPGLYCTGEMVGDLFYENYPGGSGLTAGAVFGRKAGQAIGERIK